MEKSTCHSIYLAPSLSNLPVEVIFLPIVVASDVVRERNSFFRERMSRKKEKIQPKVMPPAWNPSKMAVIVSEHSHYAQGTCR